MSTTVIEDGFDEEIDLDLNEIIPTEKSTGGGLRTDYLEDENLIQYYDNGDEHRVLVRRLVAMDGFRDSSSQTSGTQRMSLIILDYDLTSPGVFKKVTTELVFKDMAETPATERANPRIVAHAPFYTPTQWNPTDEEQKIIKSLGFELGAEYFVSAKISPEISKETTKTKHYFDKGIAQTLYAPGHSGVRHGIRWTLMQNPSAGQGAPPLFRVAVVVERASDAPINIFYKFKCSTGHIGNMWQGALRAFDSGLNRDCVIKYRPNNKSRAHEEGEAILKKLEPYQNNMAHFCGAENRLIALTPVWGLSSRVEAQKS